MRQLVILLKLLVVFTVGCTKKTDINDNTFYWSYNSNIKSLDPANASDYYVTKTLGQIYESLYHYHYLKRPLTLEPQLAEALPKASKDGLTHTIKIKKGVRFQDDAAFSGGKGRELVAQDFVYAWKRIMHPKTKSEGTWIFDDRIKGLSEWVQKVREGEADFDTPIEGFQTPDKYTLVIKLTKPFYQLSYILAMAYTAPVAREAVEKYGEEFVNQPVGTGPFRLKEWVRGNKITLVKNENYRDVFYPTEGEKADESRGLLKDAGKKLPFVDRVVIHEIPEAQPRWLGFMKGNFDASGIPKDNFESTVRQGKPTEEMQKKGVKVYTYDDSEIVYVGFNTRGEHLKNKNLRRAMSMAFDTKTFIDKFYNGRARKAHSPIPPGVDAYDPGFKNPYREYNIDKAKQLLVKAGYPEGDGLPELEYATTSSVTARQIAEYFKQNMSQIGVKIKISSSTWPQFNQKLRSGKAQIWAIAWLADYPDSENFLQLLYGPNAAPGTNYSNFNNAEFNQLYKQALLLPPSPQRTGLYRKMRDIAVAEAPWIPNAHRLGYHVHHGWVKNYKFVNLVPDFIKYLRIDRQQRADMKAKL